MHKNKFLHKMKPAHHRGQCQSQIDGFVSYWLARIQQKCVPAIPDLSFEKRLEHDPDKTEVIWFESMINMKKLNANDLSLQLQVQQVTIKPSSKISTSGWIVSLLWTSSDVTSALHYLDVSLVSMLTMHDHISGMVSTCFYHLQKMTTSWEYQQI